MTDSKVFQIEDPLCF